MADKITLTNLANLQNDTTATAAINANNAAITTAMDNTLSRDGTAPNQMGSNLDMNSNQILNLPSPSTPESPVRLTDINSTLVPTPAILTGNNVYTGTNSYGTPTALTLTNATGLPLTTGVTGTLAGSHFSAIKSINVQTFTAPGSFTYTPTAGMLFADVACVGGGGAGGGTPATSTLQNSGGGGGAAGGYARGIFSAATIGASKAVVIGAEGVPVSGASGGSGSSTTFGGAFLIAGGGTGGLVGLASAVTISGGAAGGTASTSSTVGNGFTAVGQTGFDGWSFNVSGVVLAQGGAGGNSVYGGAGTVAMTGLSSSIAGVGASAAGSGGSGSSAGPSATANIGGPGFPGSCVIIEYLDV